MRLVLGTSKNQRTYTGPQDAHLRSRVRTNRADPITNLRLSGTSNQGSSQELHRPERSVENRRLQNVVEIEANRATTPRKRYACPDQGEREAPGTRQG